MTERDSRAEFWQRVEGIFSAAVAKPAEERVAFVDQAADGNGPLREAALRLLVADSQVGRALEKAVEQGCEAVVKAESESRIGQRIGPYELVELLGRGGTSAVYLGERVDGQFRQQVAIKLVRRGMDSAEMLRRLKSERQILARLEHPNIARLLDGGKAEDGTPYFVMEAIEGEPIDAYCDRHHLSIPARLRLFATVCGAVQFAHRSLVVHRDLKPSNVLVTADGVPKLLDFGIAKVLAPELFHQGFETTAFLVRPMTPAYASPEQVAGEPITTASDIYSLGVLLYELLTGRRLVPATDSPLKLEQMIRLTAPERPSTVVKREPPGTAPGARERLAAARGERVEGLSRRLAGDLDTIVLKALRKEPARRYGTAEQFAEDILRFLEGRPVLARPDTVSYRLSKFMRRHRVGVAATAALLVAALAFTINTYRQKTALARERDRAEQIATALGNLFEIAGETRDDNLTALQVLDGGAAEVLRLSDQPESQLALLNKLADWYEAISAHARAEAMLQQALDLRRKLSPAASADIAQDLHRLGRAAARQGAYQRAEELFGQALALRRTVLGPGHLDVARSLNGQALSIHEQARYDQAEPLYREALPIALAAQGEGGAVVRVIRGNLALLLADRGAYDEAAALYRGLLAVRPADSEEADVELVEGYARVLVAQGDLANAEQQLREALATRERLRGARHLSVARPLNRLGIVLLLAGRLAEGEELIERAFEIRQEKHEVRDNLAESLEGMGLLAAAKGELGVAESHFRQAVLVYEQTFSPGHPMPSGVKALWGQELARRGQCQRANELLTDALVHLPPADWRVPPSRAALASCGGSHL